MTDAATRPLVLVSVGTDFHPFDRLVAAVDRWAAQHPEARVVVQHGRSRAPRHAEGGHHGRDET